MGHIIWIDIQILFADYVGENGRRSRIDDATCRRNKCQGGDDHFILCASSHNVMREMKRRCRAGYRNSMTNIQEAGEGVFKSFDHGAHGQHTGFENL